MKTDMEVRTMKLCIDFAYPSSPFADRHHKPDGCWHVWDESAPFEFQDMAIAEDFRGALDWAYAQVSAGLADLSPMWLECARRSLGCERR